MDEDKRKRILLMVGAGLFGLLLIGLITLVFFLTRSESAYAPPPPIVSVVPVVDEDTRAIVASDFITAYYDFGHDTSIAAYKASVRNLTDGTFDVDIPLNPLGYSECINTKCQMGVTGVRVDGENGAYLVTFKTHEGANGSAVVGVNPYGEVEEFSISPVSDE